MWSFEDINNCLGWLQQYESFDGYINTYCPWDKVEVNCASDNLQEHIVRPADFYKKMIDRLGYGLIAKSISPDKVQVLKSISCKIRIIQSRFFQNTSQNAVADDVLKMIQSEVNKDRVSKCLMKYLRDCPGVSIKECENGHLKIHGNLRELKIIMNDLFFLGAIVHSDFYSVNIDLCEDSNSKELNLHDFSGFYNYFKSYKKVDDDSISLRKISVSGVFESEIEIDHSFSTPKFSLFNVRNVDIIKAIGCDWLTSIITENAINMDVHDCKNLESIVVLNDEKHGDEYSIYDCPALTKLHIGNVCFVRVNNCNSIERIKNLGIVASVGVVNCQKFEAFEDFPKMALLIAHNCPALKLTSLPSAEIVRVTCCDALTNLNAICPNDCTVLYQGIFNVENCVNLETLQLINYGGIIISRCPEIKSLEAEGASDVTVTDCNVENLVEDFLKMPNLEKLTLAGENLTGLPQRLFDLPPTCTIDLSGCPISHEVRQSLQTVTSEEGYNGPQISFSVFEGRREQQLSVEENLKIFCDIVDEEYQPLKTKSLEDNAHFYSWLNRLSDIADYKASNEHKKWVASTVLEYIRTADQDEIFRESFLAIIAGASETCGDRVALSLLKVGILHSLHQVDIKDTDELFRVLTRGVWAMDLLEECAREKVKELRFFDEIEVYLAYPIVLKDKLGLPINQSKMLYQTCSGLKQEDFDYAENYVLQKLNDENERLNFLIKQEKWLAALENAFPAEFQKAKDQCYIDLEQHLDYEFNYNNNLKELSGKLFSGNSRKRKRPATAYSAGTLGPKRGRLGE